MEKTFQFTVNGQLVGTDEKKSLMRYLRDDLLLKSVKDGCSQGACGTCTIIVDGAAVKSCILTTEKAVGKEIVTIEGLSRREKETYVYAFGVNGAVQCGFCIPGMVISAKALLDRNSNPTED
ncbi:MAG TPA: 2Fe-2S iron-sulfur cluster binding domain-containing protein, partial [Clostridiaceae bacterium]|nr:2Fe-2S iron-sulfur cluster binding domain-containing protein [Clostridiaceae bacterium]